MMPCVSTLETDPPVATCRRAVIWLLLLLMMTPLLIAGGCQTSDDSWTRIQESGILRVGIDPTYPPFAVDSGDGITGLDVELASQVAAELGIEPQFIYFGYDGLYDALLTGQVDVLVSALVIDPDRTRDFSYTVPYYDAGQVLVVRDDNETIGDVTDLEGLILAAELGALGHVEALAVARQVPGLAVAPYGSAAEAMDAVASGEVDAALVDSTGARQRLLQQQIGEPGTLRRIAPTISSEPFAIVVRKGDQELLDQLNSALQTLIDSGRLDRLIHLSVGP